MRTFHDPYSQELWTKTEREMLSAIELRFQIGGFVIGPDGELMIIRHPIDELLDSMKSQHGINTQTGLHIQIADKRNGIRNLILSKAYNSDNSGENSSNGNFLEAYELTADGNRPANFARITPAGAFTGVSSSESKENLQDFTEDQMMNIINNGKIYLFNYIKEPGVLYAGPTAEEFHELTGLGDSGTIAPQSLAGVAFRMVQWVWKKVKSFDERLTRIEAQLQLQKPPEGSDDSSEE